MSKWNALIGSTPLPREKHVPEAKPLTKWEKFAKEKGIKKTKKSRKVYDEQTKEYLPAFGYKVILFCFLTLHSDAISTTLGYLLVQVILSFFYM
jgi:hypothetical protein